MIASNAETAIRKTQLERLLLAALQHFEKRTGRAIERLEITGGDVKTHAGQEHHVLTAVKVVLRA
jgi:hypothetical protein